MHACYTTLVSSCCALLQWCIPLLFFFRAFKLHIYLEMQGMIPTSRWVRDPVLPQPLQHHAPPAPSERTTSPAMYQAPPFRTRNRRLYEPFDTALHHHSTRSTAHAPEPGRQEHGSEAMHRRSTRDAPQQGSLEELPPPPMPRQHFRRTPTSEELSARRRREEARAASYNTRYGAVQAALLVSKNCCVTETEYRDAKGCFIYWLVQATSLLLCV